MLKQVSKKNPIWQAIAHEMLAMGYDRQPEACKSMWKAFGLEYKACKNQNKKSGSKRMTMQQLQIIDEMLGEKESTAPSFFFLDWCQKFCHNAKVAEGARGGDDTLTSICKKNTLTKCLLQNLPKTKRLSKEKAMKTGVSGKCCNCKSCSTTA